MVKTKFFSTSLQYDAPNHNFRTILTSENYIVACLGDTWKPLTTVQLW